MSYGLENWHVASEIQAFYINDDLGVTLIYFAVMSNWVADNIPHKHFVLIGGKRKKGF